MQNISVLQMESLEIEVKYFNYPEMYTYKSFPVQVFQKGSNPLLALRTQTTRVEPDSHLCESPKVSHHASVCLGQVQSISAEHSPGLFNLLCKEKDPRKACFMGKDTQLAKSQIKINK